MNRSEGSVNPMRNLLTEKANGQTLVRKCTMLGMTCSVSGFRKLVESSLMVTMGQLTVSFMTNLQCPFPTALVCEFR